MSGPPDLPPVPKVLLDLWGKVEGQRRGPKPGLTLADIAVAAVQIADTEGLAAVSMSRVAGALGFTTMSLYRYVEKKTDLYTAMLDHAYGPPDLGPSKPGDWRDALARWSRGLRTRILAHPWILEIRVTEPPLAPNQVRWMEVALTWLAGNGLSAQEQLSTLLLVDNYVRGQTQLAASLGEDAEVDVGHVYVAHLLQLADEEQFPAMWGAMASGALEDDDAEFGETEFEFGLTTVLAGVGALIEARRHP